MLTAYLSTLIVGGFLLLFSLFGGGDHEMDHDVDADLDGDLDGDADGEAHFDTHGFDAWLPIGSIRFWTFFAAFFGLVGTALTAVGDMSKTLILLCSIGVGYVSGLVATKVLRKLTKQRVGEVLGDRDLIGTTGHLTLPAGPDSPGKIRMQLGGRTLEQIAYCEEPMSAGAQAIIISVHEEGGVWIAPAPQLEA